MLVTLHIFLLRKILLFKYDHLCKWYYDHIAMWIWTVRKTNGNRWPFFFFCKQDLCITCYERKDQAYILLESELPWEETNSSAQFQVWTASQGQKNMITSLQGESIIKTTVQQRTIAIKLRKTEHLLIIPRLKAKPDCPTKHLPCCLTEVEWEFADW